MTPHSFEPRPLRPPSIPPAGPALQIVIVEDERIVARDLQETVCELGYGVAGLAATADEALALVEEHAPDLLLIDVVLKGDRDGIWLGRVLRDEHAVPFVYTTSFADRATVQQARATRPNGYLVKPYTQDDVYAAIETALATHADGMVETDACEIAEAGTPAEGALAPSVLRTVQAHVARNFNRPLSLADLARVASLSPFHFARAFKAATGFSPHAYIVRQRLDEARRLLRDTDWPVVKVAMAVGYESPSHFSTLFKREVGVPPGKYRA